jgi:hypothetical protein
MVVKRGDMPPTSPIVIAASQRHKEYGDTHKAGWNVREARVSIQNGGGGIIQLFDLGEKKESPYLNSHKKRASCLSCCA